MIIQAATEQLSFWSLRLPDVVLIIGMLGGIVSITQTQKVNGKAAATAREASHAAQVRMHTENKERLESLRRFHEEQKIINMRRDEQVTLLREQSAKIAEMAKGFNRRLELIEDRNN